MSYDWRSWDIELFPLPGVMVAESVQQIVHLVLQRQLGHEADRFRRLQLIFELREVERSDSTARGFRRHRCVWRSAVGAGAAGLVAAVWRRLRGRC
jgi:hypothetical protein